MTKKRKRESIEKSYVKPSFKHPSHEQSSYDKPSFSYPKEPSKQDVKPKK